MGDIIQGTADTSEIESNIAAIVASLPGTVYPVCILPAGGYVTWNAAKEAIRVDVNEWIRTTFPDTHTDAEGALGTGSDPNVLKAEYDNGDGLHINSDGDEALAAEIFAQSFGSTTLR